MALQSRSAALRQEIESSLASRIPAALSPQAVQAPRLLPIANEAVNALLGGGLPIGSVCEFTGPTSAGRTSLALSVLSEATVDSACAYIDVSDSLDARSAAAAGVRLKNLLWVRFSEMQVQRPSLTQTAQAQNAPAPSREQAADRSTQHHGIRHPRTETKGIDRDLEKMLVQKAQTRLKKMEGTPGFPNQRLSLAAVPEEGDAILLLLTQEPCARSSAKCVLDCSPRLAPNASSHVFGRMIYAAEVIRQRVANPYCKKAPGRAVEWSSTAPWMRAAGA
jgi:recombination protein RecA